MPTKRKQNPFALITPLLEDPEITEIMIDGTERITVEKRGKIDNRLSLAEKLGIPLNALRSRAQRVRAKLEQCVNRCKQRSLSRIYD